MQIKNKKDTSTYDALKKFEDREREPLSDVTAALY